MLTTSVEGLWVLQALLGVESMPVALHLKPFIPSAHGSLIVETDTGTAPLAQTAQYHDLLAAGVIDKAGRVDEVVRDWMKVLGRPDREVVLVIRRPSGQDTGGGAPTVSERVMVVCLHRRWMAMAARDGREIVIGGVGEAQDPDRQIELMCAVLVPAFGESAPADIDGVNVQMDALLAAMGAAAPSGREAISAALAKVGLPPHEVEGCRRFGAATCSQDTAEPATAGESCSATWTSTRRPRWGRCNSRCSRRWPVSSATALASAPAKPWPSSVRKACGWAGRQRCRPKSFRALSRSVTRGRRYEPSQTASPVTAYRPRKADRHGMPAPSGRCSSATRPMLCSNTRSMRQPAWSRGRMKCSLASRCHRQVRTTNRFLPPADGQS